MLLLAISTDPIMADSVQPSSALTSDWIYPSSNAPRSSSIITPCGRDYCNLWFEFNLHQEAFNSLLMQMITFRISFVILALTRLIVDPLFVGFRCRADGRGSPTSFRWTTEGKWELTLVKIVFNWMIFHWPLQRVIISGSFISHQLSKMKC